MRLTRDTISFMHEYMPLSNPISICAEHIRYAGATTTQSFAFAFANAKQYVELGIDAGLDVDDFVRRFTFRGFGDSTLNFLYGIAAPRAARRIWARIMRNDYGARDDRTCLLRGGEHAWGNSYMRMTPNRPVNNIVRATVEALIYSLASGEVPGGVPFDEPLGLGHSIEAQQVARDVQRILLHEGRLGDLLDPLGGSYAVESLTNEIEAETLDELKRVMEAGGSVAAIESGYCRKVVAESAWRSQQRLETGEDVWVGVNRYVGADEVEVQIQRTSEYDLERRANAEERQIASLNALRNDRPSTEVRATLRRLQTVASSNENILPATIDCAKAYATIGEVCQVLRDTFGEANYA